MKTRHEAIGAGIGSVKEVVKHHLDAQTIGSPYVDMIQRLDHELCRSLDSDIGRFVALAMIAAHLNETFSASGRLYFVDDKGEFNHTFHVSGKEREMIAALIN